MTQIGPQSELAALLRAQLVSLRLRSGPSDPAAALAGQPKRATQPTKATGTERPSEDLASAIARRVAAIDPADPDRHRKAFRVFLESVLLAEWGTELLNDPGFHQLVSQVQSQMESRADLRGLMDTAAGQLLG